MSSLIDNSLKIRKRVSTDFGRVFHSLPEGCASPKNINELTSVVESCFKSGTNIIPRGMSHSASGQCLSHAGIVIDMKQMKKIHNIKFDGKEGFIKVDAGITWESLIKACLVHNAAPPVLTDWQKLTVGGTISTGGLGFMSHISGIQADIVEEMEVVTGEGKRITCTSKEHSDLYNLVRGGLGQYGIIATATIRLEKAPTIMHVHKVLIQDSRRFSNVMDSIRGSNRFECIHSFLIPHETHEFKKKFGLKGYEELKLKFESLTAKDTFSYFIEVVQYEYDGEDFSSEPFIDNEFSFYEKVNFFDYVTKDPPLITTQKEKGSTAHPELAVFIPVSTFELFMTNFLQKHRSTDMGEGPVLIMPISTNAIKDSAFVKLEEDFYFIGILRNAFPNTQDQINHLTKLNEDLYEYTLSLGGKRYPCDSLAYPETEEEWRTHFGNKWDYVQEGKIKYDPKVIFKSLLSIYDHMTKQ